MKTKKILVTVACATALGLGLSACSSTPTPPAQPAPAPAAPANSAPMAQGNGYYPSNNQNYNQQGNPDYQGNYQQQGQGGLWGQVRNTLNNTPGLDATNIKVHITQGRVVHLSGFVNTPSQAQLAVAAAANVPGVTNVQNNLVVR